MPGFPSMQSQRCPPGFRTGYRALREPRPTGILLSRPARDASVACLAKRRVPWTGIQGAPVPSAHAQSGPSDTRCGLGDSYIIGTDVRWMDPFPGDAPLDHSRRPSLVAVHIPLACGIPARVSRARRVRRPGGAGGFGSAARMPMRTTMTGKKRNAIVEFLAVRASYSRNKRVCEITASNSACTNRRRRRLRRSRARPPRMPGEQDAGPLRWPVAG